MRYLDAYTFLFRSRKWAMNLLFLLLCLIVPIVGQIVLAGYLFYVVETFHRRGSDAVLPDFDTQQLLHYLLRGVYPYLADFTLGMIFTVPYMIGYIGIVLLWMVGVEHRGVSREVAIGITVGTVVLVLVLVVLMLFLRFAVVLRAGLQQVYGPSFSIGFIAGFLGRVGLEVVLSLLFLMVSGLVVMILGLMLCLVGVLPAAVLALAAQYHLFYQLYELYLQRGGEPIPLKPYLTANPPVPEEIVDDPRAYPE